MKSIILLISLVLIAVLARGEQLRITTIHPTEEAYQAVANVIEVVKAGDVEKVWSLGDISWQAHLRSIGISSLNGLDSGLQKSNRIVIDLAEIHRCDNKEVAYFCFKIFSGEGPSATEYYASIILIKRSAGWRFMNLPFRDFAIPFSAAIMTSRDELKAK